MLATGQEGQSERGGVGCSAMPQGHCAELAFCFSFNKVCLANEVQIKGINGRDVTVNIAVTLFVPQSRIYPWYPDLALFSLLFSRLVSIAQTTLGFGLLHPHLNHMNTQYLHQTIPNATCSLLFIA